MEGKASSMERKEEGKEEPKAAAAAPAPSASPNFALGMGRAMLAQQAFHEIKGDYEKSLEGKEGEERQKTLDALHLRSADKCLKLAQRNGGIYNKAAQFVASLQAGAGDASIPKPYIDALKIVCDKAPFRPFSEMENVVKEDFGVESLDEIFQSVDDQPLAAASLAQVHRAVLKDGTEVAVKIQYPGLLEQMASDFAVFRMFGQQIKPGGFDLTWVVNDFEVSISAELDFTIEGRNAELTGKDFAHQPYAKVPKVFWEYTTKRVLTMEFVTGMVPTNDAKALREAGMDPYKVGCMLSDLFAEMVFCTGRVHGDPHAGNVYAILDEKTNQEKIVLLDHGLYHDVTNDLRKQFCKFVTACVTRDGHQMKTLGEKFAGPLYRFFPIILSPWFVFGSKVSLEDIRAAKQKRIPPGVELKQVGEFLVGLHDTGGNLLGVLHSMGYIRGILNMLKFPERRRLKSFAKYAAAGGNCEVEAYDKDLKKAKEQVKKPAVDLSAPVQLSMAMVQVDLLALLISILAPVAILLLVLGKRNTIGIALAVLALIGSLFYHNSGCCAEHHHLSDLVADSSSAAGTPEL
ncbi:ABC1 domain-containing protein [Chloropicon primus]|uniref:ABC1 domain-containing protein n=2 Tax=Chloropicon primus TaxID=1764295 RepID=A0A5B8MCV7_9CHLO|nr:ABC1 domain-containing protein [Chloropicon primus]UPQ97598.1 ABC1 domain-containing protein [Chloropicon primus]|eukprot:QDZ18388.1 ABC1 domain-containing protein [Chloropicon primus]